MKKTIKIILVLIPMILIFSVAYLRSNWAEKELEKNGKITIVRIDSIFVPPKWSPTIYVSYYVGNEKHSSTSSGVEYQSSKEDVGKFYEFKFLPNSHKGARLNFSKEITDTTAILKAGFSREEIGIK